MVLNWGLVCIMYGIDLSSVRMELIKFEFHSFLLFAGDEYSTD